MISSQASLTELPVELRLKIYSDIITPSTFTVGRPRWHPRFRSITAIEVQLIGTSPKRHSGIGSHATPEPEGIPQGPWTVPPRRYSPRTLAFVCRHMSNEVAPLLDAVDIAEDVHFSFFAYTKDDLASWAQKMGVERMTQVQRWSMEGFGYCNSWAAEQAKEQGCQRLAVSPKCLPVLSDTAKDVLEKDLWGPDDFQRIGYCYCDIIVDLRYYKPVEHPSWRWSSEYEVGKRGTPTYTDRCCSGPGGMRDHTACSRYVRRDLNSLDMRPELKWDPQPTMAVEFLDAVLSCVVDVPPLEDIRARADEEGNEPS